MSSDLRISYRPHLEATPEAELEVLACIYRLLIQRHENRQAAFRGSCADKQGGESDKSTAPSGSRVPSPGDPQDAVSN
jgi:hypothetical protein